MKRIISLIIALCLVLGSFSFCFAAGWSDSQISSVVSDLSNIKTNIQNVNNKLTDIRNYLYTNGHSIAYWVEAIHTWMQPIYTKLGAAVGVDQLLGGLYLVEGSEASGYTYTPYLYYNNKSQAELTSDLIDMLKKKGYPTWYQNNPQLRFYEYNNNGFQANDNFTSNNTPVISSLWLANRFASDSLAYLCKDLLTGFKTTQHVVSWSDIDSSYSFTPVSTTDGLYKYLNAIQAPVARLTYVLASDQRIEAQEAAEANEQAVVDNFIDSTGAGSASPSDIGSISDLSSGYQNNFGSDASVSGIFNIFNSNNMGWFSQETVNQLDTTQRSRSSFATPILDQQIQDIYEQIGVKHD